MEEITNNEPNNQNTTETNGTAIASLVLGIVSIVTYAIPILGLILSIVGVFLAANGLKKAKEINKGKGLAIAGLICSIIGIILGVYSIIVWIMAFMVINEIVENSNNIINTITYLNTL